MLETVSLADTVPGFGASQPPAGESGDTPVPPEVGEQGAEISDSREESSGGAAAEQGESREQTRVPLKELLSERQRRREVEREASRYNFDVWKRIVDAPPEEKARMLAALEAAWGLSPQRQAAAGQQYDTQTAMQQAEAQRQLQEFWESATDNERFLYSALVQTASSIGQWIDYLSRSLQSTGQTVNMTHQTAQSVASEVNAEKLARELSEVVEKYGLSQEDANNLLEIWSLQEDGAYDAIAARRGANVFEVIFKNELAQDYEARVRNREYDSLSARSRLSSAIGRPGNAPVGVNSRSDDNATPEQKLRRAIESGMARTGWRPTNISELIPLK